MIESAEEFVRLRTSENPSEYCLAATEGADEAVWRDVITRFEDMRFWVAQNKSVPLSILRLLANDPDPRVRSMIASKRQLDENLFSLMARDSDASVRHRLTYNANIPRDLLLTLSQDEDQVVAESARNRLDSNVR